MLFNISEAFLKKLLIVIIIVMLIFGSFIRDSIFIEFNHELSVERSNTDHGLLLSMKWLWTLLFSLFYMLMACLLVILLYNNKRFVFYVLMFYTAFILVSFTFLASGMLLDDYNTGYALARRFMGMVQSPVLIMFLIPAFKLINT